MLDNHPLRERVVQEMLLRRFPAVQAPASIVQIVRIADPALNDVERSRALAMPDLVQIDDHGERHISGLASSGARMLWERHSEASTATLLLPGGLIDDAGMRWIEALPGKVMRAIRIAVALDESQAEPAIDRAQFASDDLVTCRVGPCRLWSDFRLGEGGYGRIVIAANRCSPADLGRIVQRVQELGNYRNLALLGLPMAQQHAGRLDALEAMLADHAQRIAVPDVDDEALLDSLSDLSAELAHISAVTAFRMGATRAYAAIVADRLDGLAVTPIGGHQSLADFNDRRLVPAVRTCANFSARIETLSGRAARVTALLRTRIETRIERQNRDLLTSVERGIGLQIRLQHLVESLSVLAISYYAVGLLTYLAKGAAKMMPSFPAELATAIAVVPVTLSIALFIRRRRDGLFARDDGRYA